MPQQQAAAVDYDALAQQARAKVPAPDYDALAAKASTPADPNTAETFLRHAGAQINPLPIGQLLPFPQSLGGGGWDAPITAAKNMLHAQGALLDKAIEAKNKGDYVGAASHVLHWLIPVLGPVLDQAGTELREGKYAAGLGDTAGMAASLVGPEALAAARRSGPAATIGEKAASAADARFADVMSPKGTSKAIVRTGKQAEAVAEEVRRGTTAITPKGLQEQIGQRLADASAALDEAYANAPRTAYSPGSVMQNLQKAYDALKVRGTGGSVIPAASADRAAAIQQAMREVSQLGPFTDTANLAKLRNTWKGLAQDAFTPSLNPNFQQIRGASKGWADAWSALQDALTDRHPELKPLNADYHVWKQASDVMEALADQQRAKPTVGRTILARASGATVGAAMGGPKGALAGEVVAPIVERGLTNGVAPATKMLIARQLGNLADAIRLNQTTRFEIVLKALRPLVAASTAQQAGSAPAPALASATGSQE